MVGALVVVVLAGLLMPISLLLLAVVFDLMVLAWAAVEVTRRDVLPPVSRWVVAHRRAFYAPHLGLRHR